jgi:hypothetical protein
VVNWATIQSNSLTAAQGVLEGDWPVVAAGATSAISSLVQTAQYIDANQAVLSPAQSQYLSAQQKSLAAVAQRGSRKRQAHG